MQLQDVTYKKGREMVLADTLSRAHLVQMGEIIEDDAELCCAYDPNLRWGSHKSEL